MSTIHNIQKCRRAASAVVLEHHHTNLNNHRKHYSDGNKIRHSSANATFCHHDTEQQLVLEDIEHNYCEPTCEKRIRSGSFSDTQRTYHTPHTSTNATFTRPHIPQTSDLLASGDFAAYQDANLQEFFNETTPPRRVSQVCLVNDHFILVKMPETHWRRNLPLERIMEERSAKSEADRKAVLQRQSQKDDFVRRENRFLRYFPCQRRRRVSPVLEDDDEYELPSLTRKKSKCSMSSCWRSNEETEVFESRTKLRGIISCQKAIATKVITIQPNRKAMENPLDLRVKRVRIDEELSTSARALAPETAPTLSPTLTPPPASIPVTAAVSNYHNVEQPQPQVDIFGSPLSTATPTPASTVKPILHKALQTSLHDKVQLDQRTIWHSSEPINVIPPPVVERKSKATHSLNAFHWFFKRPKSAKKSKSKSKIHAVVYKTYFVRWKKPPEEQCQHCGHVRNQRIVDSTEAMTTTTATCEWKRCHSATF